MNNTFVKVKLQDGNVVDVYLKNIKTDRNAALIVYGAYTVATFSTASAALYAWRCCTGASLIDEKAVKVVTDTTTGELVTIIEGDPDIAAKTIKIASYAGKKAIIFGLTAFASKTAARQYFKHAVRKYCLETYNQNVKEFIGF